jgi:hypothetical protein
VEGLGVDLHGIKKKSNERRAHAGEKNYGRIAR